MAEPTAEAEIPEEKPSIGLIMIGHENAGRLLNE